MGKKWNQRSKIRSAVASNIRELDKAHDRIVHIMEVYVETSNDYHAAYIGQLIAGIALLKTAHEKVYNVL